MTNNDLNCLMGIVNVGYFVASVSFVLLLGVLFKQK